jgi:hypothetical protein
MKPQVNPGGRVLDHYTQVRLGEAYDAAGDTRLARATWQRALNILTELEHAGADDVRAMLRDSRAGTTASGAEFR